MSSSPHDAVPSGAMLLEAVGLDLNSSTGRPLFRGLKMSLGRERVALIGHNGVGKSSLLAVLAGAALPTRGFVRLKAHPVLVPQDLPEGGPGRALEALLVSARRAGVAVEDLNGELSAAGLPNVAQLRQVSGLSVGETRKLYLVAAKVAQPELLILDEPTESLDHAGRAWLVEWLGRWQAGLIVASHDRPLLAQFQDFVVVAESGCRHFSGSLEELEELLHHEEKASQRRYLQRLNVLLMQEKHSDKFRLRRERKGHGGRVRELGRLTPRMRLNQKRSYAQEKQGRINRIREARIAGVRTWAKAARRALAVDLPLAMVMPRLPEPGPSPLVTLDEVAVEVGARLLFAGITLRLGRERLAVVGPNGAGKTTLLRVMLGEQDVTKGAARRDLAKIGSVAQDGADWMLDECLLEHLLRMSAARSTEDAAVAVVAHRFPLALAERPMASLSPGERVRAALICLCRRQPPVELLVLDEPSYALDFTGRSALREALCAWPGGLVVASHDEELIEAIGVGKRLALPISSLPPQAPSQGRSWAEAWGRGP
jgi:ATPase subunit of ABC transporter with duplicated ATPase domains